VGLIPSGLASVLWATLPLWMVLLNWLWTRTERPTLKVMGGVGLGLAGIVLLVGPGRVLGIDPGGVNLLGAGGVLVAAISFVVGSLYSRQANLPRSWMMATATQMLGAALLLVPVSLLLGDPSRVDWAAIPGRVWVSMGYISILGSVTAFSAYYYVLRETPPAIAASYAYVNPVVAVLVGWLVGGETFTARALVASVIIITAVVLIVSRRSLSPS
jgi:drug/metabolite transporter (DMT)-like permease